MKEVIGDIWDYQQKGWIVIPTNLVRKTDGHAMMNLGVAHQAKEKYANLEKILFALLTSSPNDPQVYILYGTGKPFRPGIIFLPTKDHWMGKANMQFIQDGLEHLLRLPIRGDVYVPLLGCGHGELLEKDILPLMQKELVSDRFIFVRRGAGVTEKYPDAFRTNRDKDSGFGFGDRSVRIENREKKSQGEA